MIDRGSYIKCPECGKVYFQEITVTKLLKGAAQAVKSAPLDAPVTPMYKEEAEVMYKCTGCGYVIGKEEIADQCEG